MAKILRRYAIPAILLIIIIGLSWALFQTKTELKTVKEKAMHLAFDRGDIQIQKSGDTFKLTFVSNGSTGYGWKVSDVSEKLDLDDITTEDLSPFSGADYQLRAGRSDIAYLKGKVLADGRYQFKLSYKRPWEKTSLDKDYLVTVESQTKHYGKTSSEPVISFISIKEIITK